MSENQTDIEISTGRRVTVKYEGIRREESLLTIDEKLLNETLLATDKSKSSAVKSFVVTNRESGIENFGVARFDFLSKTIFINIPTLTKDLQRLHTGLHSYLAEPEDKVKKPVNLLQGFLDSKFVRLINPVYWPYLGLKTKGFLATNKKKAHDYFESARKGYYLTKEGVTIPLSRERAEEHLNRMFTHATKRYLGEILAHEAEHGKSPNRKAIVKIGTTFAPVAAAFILESLSPSPNSEASALLGLGWTLGPFVTLAVGKHLDERASYQAADKYFESFTRCFSINDAVFSKEVLNKS